MQKFQQLQNLCKNYQNTTFSSYFLNKGKSEFPLNDDRLPISLINQNIFYKCKALEFDFDVSSNSQIHNHQVSKCH